MKLAQSFTSFTRERRAQPPKSFRAPKHMSQTMPAPPTRPEFVPSIARRVHNRPLLVFRTQFNRHCTSVAELDKTCCPIGAVPMSWPSGRAQILHERIGSDLAFRHGHRPRRWQSFGRSVNYNPRTDRRQDFVPARNGTAHVFKSGCPSLANRSAGKFVILHETRRERRVLIRQIIVQLASSQAAANFMASGSDFSAGGSLPQQPPAGGTKLAKFRICLMLSRVRLAYWMSFARSDTWLGKFRGSSPWELKTST